MKDKLTPFQIVLFAILIIAIVLGVLIFSLQRGSQGQQIPVVDVWGTVSDDVILFLSDEINKIEKGSININYTEFSEAVFESKLIEALASGSGPDLVLMSSDLLVKHENKLHLISYDSYPQKTFKDTFIEAGDVLLKKDGLLGLPYMIDPIVLYWNRSILNSASISMPPAFWDEMITLAPRLSIKDNFYNVKRASIALGEFTNVQNAKDILITLMMQAGNNVITRNNDEESGNKFRVTLDDRFDYVLKPAEAVLNFYTQFSNPSRELYTWNKSLPNSKELFLSGDLAFYVGFASEYEELQNKNPNLNFDVSVLPQSRNNQNKKVVLGKMLFFGLVKNSPKLAPAFQNAMNLVNQQNIKMINSLTKLPPVRRDLLVEQNSNAVMQVFYSSALISRVFLDPDSDNTKQIIFNMVESYTSGRSTLSEVLIRAQRQLQDLFN